MHIIIIIIITKTNDFEGFFLGLESKDAMYTARLLLFIRGVNAELEVTEELPL
jgi:hypothetical protein